MTSTARELDHRISDGIDVRLMWAPETDALHVEVLDAKTGEAHKIEVRDGERALDVFGHPFAYAARRRQPRTVGAVRV